LQGSGTFGQVTIIRSAKGTTIVNSKERVRCAINHCQPDRVPIDFHARGEITSALMAHLGVAGEERLREVLGVDVRSVGPTFMPRTASALRYADPTTRVADGIYYDIWGVGFRPNQTSVGFYMDLASSPLRGDISLAELDDYPWPTADLWDYRHIAQSARSYGQYWVWSHSRGVFEISWFLRGFDRFMLDLVDRPGFAGALMDHVQFYLMNRTHSILDSCDGQIDMIEYNDDVGGQNGLLISPSMWRAFLKPRMAAIIQMCKSYGVRVRYHSCGGIRPIIPDLIEVGVDVLNPVQTHAAGMEPMALKRDFGAHLTFDGGVDTQRLLPMSSAAQVSGAVRCLIDTLGRDGGYILAPSHALQADVPLGNVVAMYETALRQALLPGNE
jgi:uroporphyrinogen decarboxylase